MADEFRGVVAVGASAGGVEALTSFASGLPPRLPYAVLVVLHMAPNAPSVLPRIIDRSGPLKAVAAADRQPLEAGHIYVTVPDRHLMVTDHHVVLSEGPTESAHRPAVNALFRSAAVVFGHRAVGVLMSGALDDGVAGLAAIRSRGGVAIVQEPSDAMFADLPNNAIRAGVADHRSPAAHIGALLTQLAESAPQPEVGTVKRDSKMELENRIAMGRRFSTSFDSETLGAPSGYTCPDCNGSLVAVDSGSYRCRVGHAWTADALLAARDTEVENALWIALRSLREKATMSRRLAKNVGSGALYDRYTAAADEADHAVTVLGERLLQSYDEIDETRGG